jgi:hypothetical protein
MEHPEIKIDGGTVVGLVHSKPEPKPDPVPEQPTTKRTYTKRNASK